MSMFAGMYGASLGDRTGPSMGIDTSTEARRAERRMHDVEQRLEKLTLITMAMWSLLQQETNLTEEDLMERVRQIDLMDGRSDGRITPQIARCSQCNRVMNPRHSRCLYCGQEKLIVSAFDSMM